MCLVIWRFLICAQPDDKEGLIIDGLNKVFQKEFSCYNFQKLGFTFKLKQEFTEQERLEVFIYLTKAIAIPGSMKEAAKYCGEMVDVKELMDVMVKDEYVYFSLFDRPKDGNSAQGEGNLTVADLKYFTDVADKDKIFLQYKVIGHKEGGTRLLFESEKTFLKNRVLAVEEEMKEFTKKDAKIKDGTCDVGTDDLVSFLKDEVIDAYNLADPDGVKIERVVNRVEMVGGGKDPGDTRYYKSMVGDMVAEEGQLTKGYRTGTWMSYLNKKLMSKTIYLDMNEKDIDYFLYDEAEKVSHEHHIRNGKKEGKELFFQNGKRIKEMNFKEDLLHGKFLEMWDTVRMKLEGEYVMGNKSGTWKMYGTEGQLLSKEVFTDPKLQLCLETIYQDNSDLFRLVREKKGDSNHGLCRIYNFEGKLYQEETYVDGKRNGPFREFFTSEGPELGKVSETGQYVNDLEDGIWTEYDEEGKVEKVVTWKMGVKVE